MREIVIMANEDGSHFLQVGLDADSLSSFKWQLYIHKTGKRTVDWVQSMAIGYVSFLSGDLWVHNSDTAPRANLFGEQKNVKVGVVVNEQANTLKIFDTVGVHSDGCWEIESVIVPPSLNHPQGMNSKVPKERFKKRNGVYRAEFLRNLKSTSDSDSIKDAISGEELKGHYCYLVLKNVNNSSGEQVKLFKLDVNATTLRGQ